MNDTNNIPDIIKSHTVVVENGSGVLIQPMTDEYSYILTAKHVVQNDDKKPELGIKNAADIKIQIFSGEELQARKIYHHNTLDIAVIRIDFAPNLSITPYQKSIARGDKVSLYGYPNYSPEHRNENHQLSDWIETYDLCVIDTDDHKLGFRNEETARQSDIQGFSGGGLFYISRDQAYLIGIEHSVIKPAEYADRVIGCPIANFNEILNANQLKRLKPLHLSSFKHLQDEIFVFENCFDVANLKSITGLLNHYATQQLTDCLITPIEILRLFKGKLKAYQQSESELEKKGLWIALLELLAIEVILNPPALWNADYIESLLKSYRIIYIDSHKSWKAHLEKILATDTAGLKPDGKILLVTGGLLPESPNMLNNLPEQVIPNIFNGLTGEAINNARYTYTKKTPIIHLPKLHNVCIEEKESDYAKLNRVIHETEMADMLRADYNQYLQVVESNNE